MSGLVIAGSNRPPQDGSATVGRPLESPQEVVQRLVNDVAREMFHWWGSPQSESRFVSLRGLHRHLLCRRQNQQDFFSCQQFLVTVVADPSALSGSCLIEYCEKLSPFSSQSVGVDTGPISESRIHVDVAFQVIPHSLRRELTTHDLA